MILKRNNFILDHIGKKPISSGLIIRKLYKSNETIDVAYIVWDKKIDNCSIHTVSENFQNNVVLYKEFKDFIYLVDNAYSLISQMNGKKEFTGLENENINF